MASDARCDAAPEARRRARQRPGARALGLLACAVLLCGADWRGTYEGDDAGNHRLVLKGGPEEFTVDVLRVAIGDPAQCQLRVEGCPALLEGSGFRAGPCRAELAGPQGGGCEGSTDLFLRGTELANDGTVVTSLRLRSTLNDWPVVLERRAAACGLGFELAGVVPLLGLARRRLGRYRARCDAGARPRPALRRTGRPGSGVDANPR